MVKYILHWNEYQGVSRSHLTFDIKILRGNHLFSWAQHWKRISFGSHFIVWVGLFKRLEGLATRSAFKERVLLLFCCCHFRDSLFTMKLVNVWGSTSLTIHVLRRVYLALGRWCSRVVNTFARHAKIPGLINHMGTLCETKRPYQRLMTFSDMYQCTELSYNHGPWRLRQLYSASGSHISLSVCLTFTCF